MIEGVFRLHASQRLDITITLYAIWKYLPITMSVNLFCTLDWMLTFQFTMPGLNMTHANIFHYPHLWISARVDVNIPQDIILKCILKMQDVFIMHLMPAMVEDDRGRSRNDGSICDFHFLQHVNICYVSLQDRSLWVVNSLNFLIW